MMTPFYGKEREAVSGTHAAVSHESDGALTLNLKPRVVVPWANSSFGGASGPENTSWMKLCGCETRGWVGPQQKGAASNRLLAASQQPQPLTGRARCGESRGLTLATLGIAKVLSAKSSVGAAAAAAVSPTCGAALGSAPAHRGRCGVRELVTPAERKSMLKPGILKQGNRSGRAAREVANPDQQSSLWADTAWLSASPHQMGCCE